LGDGDLDHVGDIGSARASLQNSPRAREVSNAGATHFAGQDSKGTPSRLGGPPGCSDSKSHANRLPRHSDLRGAQSRIGSCHSLRLGYTWDNEFAVVEILGGRGASTDLSIVNGA
jgi:hypothetical protein